MAFQAVPETVEITIVFSQNDETLTNTLHARLTGGYDLADVVALADDVDALAATWLIPQMTAAASYVRTEVRGLAVINDVEAENNDGTGPGTIAQEGMPNSVTLSLKKGSGLTGRSARGRWYVVGIPEPALSSNENVFLASEVTARAAAVNAIRAGIAATLWTPVIVSRYTGGVLREFGETFEWLTTVAIDNFVDTQRRRLSR